MQKVLQALQEYAQSVRRDRKVNPATSDGSGLEPLLAPRFHSLIETVLAQVSGKPPRVLPEYNQTGVGRPDLALVHEGSPARAFIELKEPRLHLEPRRFTGHNKEQFARFANLPLWVLCNFERIQLYRRDELEAEALVLPAVVLDPDMSDRRANRIIRNHDSGGFRAILQTLASADPPVPETAEDVATHLAHAARLVREVVYEHCRSGAVDPVVSDLRVDFLETLFARAEAGGYDATDENSLFSNAFAQTLLFGLLLARHSSERMVGVNAHELLPHANFPLLRGTLRALTMEETRAMLGAAFDVAVDAVNAVKPALLMPANGRDPMLYLYEDFLRVFDPQAVKRYGVYYTPPEVVTLMVAEVERMLRGGLRTKGLLDPNVNVLDPACGTGTFLIAATSLVADRATEAYGPAAAAAEVTSFARRAHAFELLVGPYTVAHYRMQREVSRRGGETERLPIFLTDTLAPTASEAGIQPNMAFLSAPLIAERKAADQVKSDKPILVVMGNPPYKRLQANEATRLVGPFVKGLWEDLKQPVKEAGLGLSLNAFPDLYIAFYRWALWRLFEAQAASGRGVLAFITNRTFLAGPAFGGLRRMLRRRFERIRIIDFRGDKRTARPAGPAVAPDDENIFDIRAGVCVLLAEAPGRIGPTEPRHDAKVEYADIWRHGAFDRAAKLGFARRASTQPDLISFVETSGQDMEPLTPRGFPRTDWPSLDALFDFRSNGIVTYRDAFSYASRKTHLLDRVERWLSAPLSNESRMEFKETQGRKAGPAHQTAFDESAACLVSYRPLDRRFLYNRREFVDRPRLDTLQAAWGTTNCALHALNDGTGGGPAVWCHGVLPDQHAFNGRGGWVFPLYDEQGRATLSGAIAGLSNAYGTEPEPRQVFDAILALLSAADYTVRFAFDLENDFPHVPLPSSEKLLCDAARLGGRIRELETFGSAPGTEFTFARLDGTPAPRLRVPTRSHAFRSAEKGGQVALADDWSFVVSDVSEAAWNFSVSGYPVLHRWLQARNGEPVDAVLQREILDIVGRIEELLHRFEAANPLLDQAVAMSLSKDVMNGGEA